MSKGACLDDTDVHDALDHVPVLLRRYFTPGTAIALAQFNAGVNLQASFKVAAAAGRKRCCCCLLRNKPRCCVGRSQIERAAYHGCTFCTNWIVMGYGSTRPLAKALELVRNGDIGQILQHELSKSPDTLNIEAREGFTPPAASIPHVVHQIWIGPNPPPLRWIDTWRKSHAKAHPSWQHLLWRDEDIVSLLPSELRRIYDTLEQWCLKADIARYAILVNYGGVYVDADMVWLEQHGLDSVIEGRTLVLALESPPAQGFGMDERIGNAIIGVPPCHPLMSRVLHDMIRNFAKLEAFLGEGSPFMQQYKIGYRLTSPVALTQAFFDLQMDCDSLLPTSTFYPVPWWRGQSLSVESERIRIEFPSAISTHYGYSTNQLGKSNEVAESMGTPKKCLSQNERGDHTKAVCDDKLDLARPNPDCNGSEKMAADCADGVKCDDWLAKSMNERQRQLWQAAMAKIRHERETMGSTSMLPPSVVLVLRSASFAALCVRKTRCYDSSRHPLRESFLDSVGHSDLQLDRWHETVPNFASDSPGHVFQHKTALLESLKDQSRRAVFEKAYHRFVHEVVAPDIAAAMEYNGSRLTKLCYAAFPCIRIVPPSNNWTIRPHADFMYGHPAGSINIWVPLTSASGSNTLFAESSPGAEDFEPMNLEYGQLCRWYGTQCAHFTLPNISGQTRVSIDFRVVPENAFSDIDCSYAIGGYYAVCEVDPDGLWRCTTAGEVSGQHGFPFITPKMKYY